MNSFGGFLFQVRLTAAVCISSYYNLYSPLPYLHITHSTLRNCENRLRPQGGATPQAFSQSSTSHHIERSPPLILSFACFFPNFPSFPSYKSPPLPSCQFPIHLFILLLSHFPCTVSTEQSKEWV